MPTVKSKPLTRRLTQTIINNLIAISNVVTMHMCIHLYTCGGEWRYTWHGWDCLEWH